MCGVVGPSTSSFQKTAEAVAYHCAEAPPTIRVVALLRLAQWCEQHRRTQGGNTSCPPRYPPVASAGPAAAAAQGTVAPAAGAAATSGRSTAQRPDSAPSPRARRQGGGQRPALIHPGRLPAGNPARPTLPAQTFPLVPCPRRSSPGTSLAKPSSIFANRPRSRS